jgi:hypothetical protein
MAAWQNYDLRIAERFGSSFLSTFSPGGGPVVEIELFGEPFSDA